ncbi:MAG: Acetyltransferase domain [Pseudomonadota bacterium]|jgi:GNAT superfamily N-acetyltransferase
MGRIRQFRTSDAASCSEIIQLCLAQMADLSPEVQQAVTARSEPQTLASEMSAGNAQVYESALGVVGLVLLLGENLDRLYVHPQQQSQGIGIALLSEVTRLALRSRVPRLVTQSWPAAVSYYESVGFTQEAGCSSVEPGMPCIRLVKRLTSA